MREPEPPAEPDDLRTLLKGVAIGIGASGVAFFAVGNADERPHRPILLTSTDVCGPTHQASSDQGLAFSLRTAAMYSSAYVSRCSPCR